MDLQKFLFIIESILDFFKGNLFMICNCCSLQKIAFSLIFTMVNKKTHIKFFKKATFMKFHN